jgi:hypothetical protein
MSSALEENNVYLNGGKNMAEAIRQSHNQSD